MTTVDSKPPRAANSNGPGNPVRTAKQKQVKVLFVDDDTQLLGLLRQLMFNFSREAWEIYTAPDAVSALSIIQSQNIRLLVIDLHMPAIDGLDFLKLLE